MAELHRDYRTHSGGNGFRGHRYVHRCKRSGLARFAGYWLRMPCSLALLDQVADWFLQEARRDNSLDTDCCQVSECRTSLRILLIRAYPAPKPYPNGNEDLWCCRLPSRWESMHPSPGRFLIGG